MKAALDLGCTKVTLLAQKFKSQQPHYFFLTLAAHFNLIIVAEQLPAGHFLLNPLQQNHYKYKIYL